MKVIVLMPVRNEEWILEKSLKAASLFSDAIIVGDQHSTDMTPRICRSFKKVVYVVNDSPYPGTQNRRQILLNKARELYGGGNILFCLDADEIPTADIFNNREWHTLLENLKPLQSVLMQWIMLWRSPYTYRSDDSVWSDSWKHFLFKDDGKTDYPLGNVHESRVLDEKNSVQFDPVKVLHFQFVVWHRMLAKQAHCRVMEYKTFPKKNTLFINQAYGATKDERGMKLVNVPRAWVGYWEKNGIELNFSEKELTWYEIEILQDFNRFGGNSFKWLDIWDIDWEKKRQLAQKDGIKGIPNEPIADPRNIFIKVYHRYLQALLHFKLIVWPYRLAKRIFHS